MNIRSREFGLGGLPLSVATAAWLIIGGCNSSSSAPVGAGAAGTTTSTGGHMAETSTGGSGQTGGSGAGGVAGNRDATGGAVATGAGGAIVGPSTGGQAGTSTGGQAGAGGVGAGDLDQIYEAESIPPNQLFGFARADRCAATCAKPLTPGADCCSGGGEVSWIVSQNGAHTSGWMQFNAISAPADGMYDVTFWYHCGLSDTYGDNNCGGQPSTEVKQVGCRPHVLTVNGTVTPGTYHFPCFSGAWSTLHVATVSLPLTRGMNTILVAAPPPRDAVDVDAIEIISPGKGRAPRSALNTSDPLGK